MVKGDQGIGDVGKHDWGYGVVRIWGSREARVWDYGKLNMEI